jgi:hypothetical protein
MLAMDPRWLYLDLRLLSSGQRRVSASVGAPYNFPLPSSSLLCLFLVSAAKWTQTLAIAANVSRAVASGNV